MTNDKYTRILKAFPGAERRPSQERYWEHVESTLAVQGSSRLVIEGGCGTGKSIAYLIPLLDRLRNSGGRAVISTSGKALQEQLITKDIPAACRIVGQIPFSFLQGKSNYLCMRRIEQVNDLENAEFYREIKVSALDPSFDGSVTKLGNIPVKIRANICGSNDTCDSKECKDRECFFFKAKQKAADSTLVVVNHHLLVRHFEMEKVFNKGVLGEFDYLILDEAHELPDIARDCLGFRITAGQFYTISREIERRFAMFPEARSMMSAGLRFSKLVENLMQRGIKRIQKPLINEEVKGIVSNLSEVSERLRTRNGTSEGAVSLAEGVKKLLENFMAAVTAKELDKYVYWFQAGDNNTQTLECRFLDPRFFLDNSFGERRVVATSATLETGGNFKFVMSEIGLTGATTIKIPSPFDFKQNCRLLIPSEITVEPNDPAFEEQAMLAIAKAAEACCGRMLGLFTSRKMLNLAFERLSQVSNHKVIMQGQDTVEALVAEVKRNPGTILLGTNSLWTGIDIQGDAVTCVLIDKIPFKSPDDPVHAALCERNSNPFLFVSLPRALMAIRQGAGRLIRSSTDRGVVCFLDRRLDTKSYGKTLREALPYMPRISTFEEMGSFLCEPSLELITP